MVPLVAGAGRGKRGGRPISSASVRRGRSRGSGSRGCLEAERRLSQDLAVEVEANRAYYAYRAGGRMRDGRRFGKPPAVWVAPEEPTGEINLTDPDSRNMLAA